MKLSEDMTLWVKGTLVAGIVWTGLIGSVFILHAVFIDGSRFDSIYEAFTEHLGIWAFFVCAYLFSSGLLFFIHKTYGFIEDIFTKKAETEEFKRPKYRLDPDSYGTYDLKRWNGQWYSFQRSGLTKSQADKAISELERNKVYYVEEGK